MGEPGAAGAVLAGEVRQLVELMRLYVAERQLDGGSVVSGLLLRLDVGRQPAFVFGAGFRRGVLAVQRRRVGLFVIYEQQARRVE